MKRLAENRLLRPILYSIHAILTRAGEKGSNREELYRRVARMHAEKYCGYVYGSCCSECTHMDVCDGLHGDYAKLFGTGEIRALKGQLLYNPRHYINSQEKVMIMSDRESQNYV